MQTAQKPLKQIASYLMFDVVLDQNVSGTVYKAKHKDTSEPCLIKVITKERIKQDPSFHERIRLEEKILQTITNPRFLRFHSLIETGNYYYFISEGSDEGPLEVGRGGFPEEEVLGVLVMVLQGYFEFFKRALPYNNFSCRSFFRFGKEYRISLFYLADYYEKMENSFKSSKPPSVYSSPEALEGAANSPKRDIWALGIIIYELLFGKTPFAGENVLALARSIEKNLGEVYKTIETAREVSQELKACLKRMLETDNKRLTWQELVEGPLLKNFRAGIEAALIRDYDSIAKDVKSGKAKLKNAKIPLKPLPPLGKEPGALRRETLETIENIDNIQGNKAKLLLIMDSMIRDWVSIFQNAAGDPIKLNVKASPQKTASAKKTKSKSPTKKKQKAFSERLIDEPDDLQIDEDISVNLPLSLFEGKSSEKVMKSPKKNETANQRPESVNDLQRPPLPAKQATLKKTRSKEEKKKSPTHKEEKPPRASLKNLEGEDESGKDTLKIMKPSTYPQLSPHDKDTEKARMDYLKSLRVKKETLKPILEMSIEESSTLDTLTISVVKSNFQDVIKEFFYRYLHENEILEFLYGVSEELRQAKSLMDRDFTVFCLVKLIIMRFEQLKSCIELKTNVFSLDFWKEIVNLDIYRDVRQCIMENERKYVDCHGKAYLRAKNQVKGLSPEQTRFLNSDFNVPHSEFNRNFNEAMLATMKGIYSEAKGSKKINTALFGLLYRLMLALEISKTMSFIRLDLELEFDIVEFQERLAELKPEALVEEVERKRNSKFVEMLKK